MLRPTTGSLLCTISWEAQLCFESFDLGQPFLAPLYAFDAVLQKGTVARIPELVFVALLYIREQLAESKGLHSVLQDWRAPREAFRTDAKCENNLVVLGGYSLECGMSPSDVIPGDLPCLFKEGGDSQWASTSAELLASLAALKAFNHLERETTGVHDCIRTIRTSVCGGTDNSSTAKLQKKGSSTKWPLMGIQMACAAAFRKVNKQLTLQWRPGTKTLCRMPSRITISQASVLSGGFTSSSMICLLTFSFEGFTPGMLS